MPAQLVIPKSDADWRRARELIEEYQASLGVDLCFQNIAHELAHLPEEYGPPTGAFLLAGEDGAYFGCVGLRRIDDAACEMKRLYVAPTGRGKGVGRLLAERIVTAAKTLKYSRVRLDTLHDMKTAQALYATMGFKSIDAYRFNPLPGTTYLELEI